MAPRKNQIVTTETQLMRVMGKESSCVRFTKHVLPVLVALGLLFGAIAWMMNSSDKYQNKNIERIEEKIDKVDVKVDLLTSKVDRDMKTGDQLVRMIHIESTEVARKECERYHQTK